MFNRLLKLPAHNSFFLFGPRGSGKTWLLKQALSIHHAHYIDLLDAEKNDLYYLKPNTLLEELAALPKKTEWIFIDEIQKLPKLLDLVHQQIESSRFKFALTGSSARKLKRGGANLLAGRAFVHYLFPLTAREIGTTFSLEQALQWGTLPKIFSLQSDEEKKDFLRTYTHTYLKEEITEEQIVRRLDPFRKFLYVAAQMSGQIVNFSKIGREIGASVPTIQSYFEILEDTLIGTLLESFHESIRKRQRENPKFYFFDTGVQRALGQTLNLDIKPRTSAFGLAFEHFVINEIIRLNFYGKKDYQLSYLRTKDDVEVDLVIERPGLPRALVEIKSKDRVMEEDVKPLQKISRDIARSEAYLFSLDPTAKKIGNVHCLHWNKGLEEIGL